MSISTIVVAAVDVVVVVVVVVIVDDVSSKAFRMNSDTRYLCLDR